MNRYYYSLFILLSLLSLELKGQEVYSNENYIYIGISQDSTSGELVLFPSKAIESIVYYDGLGRAKQEIQIKGGGGKEDIIRPVYYDQAGRESRVYLPYSSSKGVSGNFREDAFSKVNEYYATHYPYEINAAYPNPYSEKDFEASPLNRVLRESSPGKSWKLGSGHEIKYDYSTNSSGEVLIYKVDLNSGNSSSNVPTPRLLGGASHYKAGELYKNIVKDEHWDAGSGKRHTVEEFKDKQGRIVLKRSYVLIKARFRYGGKKDFPVSLSFGHNDLIGDDDLIGGGDDEGNDWDDNWNNDWDDNWNNDWDDNWNNDWDDNTRDEGNDWDDNWNNDWDDNTGDEGNDWDDNASIPPRIEVYDTYYVYDDYGNLTYILPPKADADKGRPAQNILDALCYQYVYDHRNRLVEKKLPGKGWEYIVYNKLDQIVLTKDSKNGWLFTKYDALGRVAYTGLAATTASRSQLQSLLDNAPAQNNYEVSSSSALSIGGSTLYYSNRSEPKAISQIYSVNYYDRYGYPNKNVDLTEGAGSSMDSYNKRSTTRLKGLPTVTKTRILGTNKWITAVNYYDSKERVLGVYSKNTYLGTVDIVKNNLDFPGKVKESTHIHKKGNSTLTTRDKFEYDHMGRLLIHKQKLGNGSEEIIAENHYDDLGQLIQKGVGGKINKPRLQTIDYTYNIRGWMTGINNTNSLGSDLFAFGIRYNTPKYGADAAYNGNICETEWRTKNDNILRYYKYSYDDLNRITRALDNSDKYSLRNISYDKNGNILNLERRGHINTSCTEFGLMDSLSYIYDAGNKLLRVEDGGSKNFGFKEPEVSNEPILYGSSTNSFPYYEYDINGNLIKDFTKDGVNITYNHLNLPTDVRKFSNYGGMNVKYIYSADGAKQRKIVNEQGNINTTDYAGGYIYRNGKLEFIRTAEGYAMPSGGGYRYVYEYKDHLGNIRLSYTDANNDGKVTKSEIIEENNYYPFGLKHKGYNNNVTSLGNSLARQYKYNGKELNEELGLNWYDYGARNYQADLGRWFNVDPLAEKAPDWSPFRYGFNNPIMYIDPTGLSESTHTDKDGKVIAVYDDGDLGVYKHDDAKSKEDVDKKHSKDNTSAGGEKMGETEYWDEFRAHDNETGKVLPSVQKGAIIMYGESWDYAIYLNNREANKMDLSDVAVRSLPNKTFDIKTKTTYAPHGQATGKLLNGKYATARSAGNYLAGMNGAAGTFGGKHISLETYMRMAGAVHAGINFKGAPYYGEIPYAGRRIVAGFIAGLKKRKND